MTYYDNKDYSLPVRNRTRFVRTFPQVYAIKVEDNDGVARDVAAGGYGALVRMEEYIHGVHALRQAGWVFVAPNAADLRTLVGKPGVLVGRVVTEADYSAKIDLGLLNIAFKAGVDRARAEAILTERGVTITRALGFVPQGYTAKAAPGSDGPAIAAALATHPEIEWIEPDFIEVTGPRNGPRTDMNGPRP